MFHVCWNCNSRGRCGSYWCAKGEVSCLPLIPHPHLLVSGHQRTVCIIKGCNQWLSLAKTLIKMGLAGGNHSLIARTSKCGWAITQQIPNDSGMDVFLWRQQEQPINNCNMVACKQLKSTWRVSTLEAFTSTVVLDWWLYTLIIFG